MSCGVSRRHSLDQALLWLLNRPAATAPIRPLAWKPPYAVSMALKKKKKKKRKKEFYVLNIPSTQQDKIHNDQQPVKNWMTHKSCKEAGKYNPW